MKCMNSIAYAQREIDRILRPIKDIACAYIDDIVCGFETLKEHIADLHKLFTILSKANVFISPKKTFLEYPDISLLDQKINAFGLATTEDKLEAIANIQYPTILEDLEHYLDLTEYLRNYVHYYAQLARPLQELKTKLLKEAFIKGNPRKAYASRLKLGLPTSSEDESFRSL